MMRRRPPGERGQPGQRKLLFALVLALMPLQLVAAGPQISQRNVVDLVDVVDVSDVGDVADDTRYNSPPEANHYQPSLASLASHLVETRETSDGNRTPKKNKHKAVSTTEPKSSAAAHSPRMNSFKNSKNALHKNSNNSTAPDLSVRAPSPAHRDPAPLSGSELNSNSGLAGALASPHIARSLVDWEVEDYVLLATVNGDLHSVHRKTGKTLWHTESDKPVVETVHHRAAIPVDDPSYTPLDHWIWAIEPSGDGAIYLMIPGGEDSLKNIKNIGGLTDTGLTMKTIVEQVPYNDPHHPVVFMGTKDATMMTIDAVTGHVKDWYSSSDANVNNDKESCMRPNDYFDDVSSGHEECAIGGTITLGRMDYKVVVYRTSDGAAIATLRYSEWGPNNYDNDLHRQYRSPMDNRYITGKPSGDVYGFNVAPATGDYKLSFTHHLDTPVVRVFDIARPPNVPLSSNPDLALLPQPPPPAINDEDAGLRRSSVFVNETEAGDWYALSGTSYPLIVDAPDAQCTRIGWWDRHPESTPQEHRPAMAGKHTLASGALNSGRRRRLSSPTLPGDESRSGLDPKYYPEIDGYDERVPLTLPGRSEVVEVDPATTAESVIEKVKELPQVAGRRVFDFFSNPVLIIILVVAFYRYRRELYLWSKRQGRQLMGQVDDEAEDDVKEEETVDKKLNDKADSVLNETEVKTVTAKDVVEAEAKADTKTQDTPSESAPLESASSPSPPSNGSAAGSPPEKEKKKNHRGRRGGAKHKKGGKAAALRSENSMTQNDDSTSPDGQPPTVDEVVGKAKQLGAERTTLHPEPDVVTVSYNTVPGKSDMEEVSSPILRMGSLEVNTNVQLGTGSNGTIVFAGKFDGREVAVKRMLIQFYDIASQETKLLRESDDHPNVIRYYAQQQHANFHYIALELCRASLADVIERSFLFRDIAEAGERDLPGVLYQITNGLHHLHARNIVHRDLKPQNILVNMIDGQAMPRMLISDFGLCKKLDGGQSSFGATTAHAAGTTGWRAPELLLDDDERDNNNHQHMATMVEAMTTQSGGSNYNHTNNGTGASGSGQPSSTRRVTKSIDIFSLGLVFHYVLTKGYHPFDVGDRYMREVNIRKDTYKLDRLDVLGNYAYEAKDLIERMISRTPSHRPRTREIMSHPFFWSPKKRLAFLCDVSDHFEKEPRDPPSAALGNLEAMAADICGKDFLKKLPREFVDSLGKQRKYTGTRLLDLLRALRNKRNHYEDMPPALRQMIGGLPEGYLSFWTTRFTNLLIRCWRLGIQEEWADTERFSEYYRPPVPA